MEALTEPTNTSAKMTRLKGIADAMINDGVDSDGGALRSLLLKLALVAPTPFVVSFRIVGFQWADEQMSGGAPATLTSLVGSAFSLVSLPIVILLSFGIAEVRECFSLRYKWFFIPGCVNGVAKVLLFTGVKSVDATTVSVLTQCSILWVIVLHAAFRRQFPTSVQGLSVVSIVTVATTYVLAQSTEHGPLNAGGFILVLVGMFLDDLGIALLAVCASSENSALSEKLRAILMNDVMKMPVLLVIFVFFEVQTVRDNGVQELLSVPYIIGACVGSHFHILFGNLCVLISGQVYYGMAGNLSVLVTYAVEVAIVQTQALAALPVLQLVALTAIIVLVGLVEYKLLEATFHGRHGALVSIRRKMSAERSTWRTGSVARSGDSRFW